MSGTLTAVVVGAVALVVGRSAWRTWSTDWALTRRTLLSIRWWMLPGAVATLAATLGAWWLLSQVPWLNWGWWALLGNDASNIIVGQTGREGVGWEAVAVLVPLVLMFAVPRFARDEERTFREYAERRSWPRRALLCLLFGLVHLLMGIPIAAGLAISLMGGYYTAVYLLAYRREWRKQEAMWERMRGRGSVEVDIDGEQASTGTVSAWLARYAGVNAATAAHTVYNWLVLSIVVVALLVEALWGVH